MLEDTGSNPLLPQARAPSASSTKSVPAPINPNNQIIQKSSVKTSNRESVSNKKKKKKKKENQTQFTSVLKIFNIIVGLGVIAFGVACYYLFSEDTKNLDFVGYILPGYVAFSGLIIILAECNIGFMIRNMRFLYGFIGKGLFNIYVGIMPLSLLRLGTDTTQDQTFQILIIVVTSLMCLIGVLYIVSKIFCCAKEGNKGRRRSRSRSDSSSDSD